MENNKATLEFLDQEKKAYQSRLIEVTNQIINLEKQKEQLEIVIGKYHDAMTVVEEKMSQEA